MKKAKADKDSRSYLNVMYQKALIDGVTATNTRSIKRPFNVKINLGGLEAKLDLLATSEELVAFFIITLLARNEKLDGRKLGDYTDDETRSLLSQHQEERNRYMPLALALLNRQIKQKIEKAMEELLSEVKWQALYKMGFPVNSNDLCKLLSNASNETKRRVDAPGAGRRKGSITIKPDEERQYEQAEFEERVINAIMKLYPANNYKKPLKKVIAREIGISARHLTRKTKSSVGKTFDELVEIAEMRQRN